MARLLVLSLSLCFLLFSGCLALREQPQQNECQFQRLNSFKPDNRIETEAGLIETWNPTKQEFRCAGVALARYTLRRNALRRPFYSNAPQEIFIQQGNGLFGMIFPGCPQTYEETQESQQHGESSRRQDSHQKVQRFREGDVIAVPNGVVFWMYNEEDTPVVAISLFDTNSYQNQLDPLPRIFSLAGNHEHEFLQYQQQKQEEENEGGNILGGFPEEFLEDSLNVNRHIVKNLQGENEDEQKGAIVRVKGGLSIISPPERQPRHRSREEEEEEEERQPRHRRREEEEEEEDEDEEERQPRHRRREEEEEEEEREPRCRKDRRGHCSPRRRSQRNNGLEETLCTTRLHQNIGRYSSPDIYNPQAGSIKTLSSLDFQALRWLGLSAEHGNLHRNAMFVPHYNLNANSLLYVLRGRARIQVVDCSGKSVFDEELEEGRVLIIPQNFAVAAKSQSERFEYVAFKTNDRAMIATLAGGSSLMRAMPEEVIANAFNLRREEARQVKNNNPFKFLVPPRESENKASA